MIFTPGIASVRHVLRYRLYGARMKKLLKFLTGRLFIISMLILIQILLIVLPTVFLSTVYVPLFFLFLAVDLFLVLAIVNRNYNPSFKIAWLIPVLCIPIGGALLYILFGRNHLNKKNTERLKNAVESSNGTITADRELLTMIGEKNAHLRREPAILSIIHAAISMPLPKPSF